MSLDPQTEYERPSEAESLKSFQSSFHGDLEAAGTIAKPGDIIQFFVEPSDLFPTGPNESRTRTIEWGVGDVNRQSELREKQLRSGGNVATPLLSRIFGASSAEGLYLSNPTSKTETKIDATGSRVVVNHEWSEVKQIGSRSIKPAHD